MKDKKFRVWLPLLFSVVMIAGMTFGFQLNRQAGGGSFFQRDRRGSLQEALDLIRSRYVDSVGIDSLQDDALQEVMNSLDPHSVYIPASRLSEANEDLAGNFQGIGVEFNVFEDTVHVLYVVPGGPSDAAGVQVGDRLLRADTASLLAHALSNEAIRQRIRGEAGSSLQLTLLRGGKQQTVTVKRGTIPLPSLDASFMLDATTGYIKLSKFSETTYREFMQAMEGLQAKGLKALVLDLRGNGGGFMMQATSIADEFLDGNKLIVYTQGTNIEKTEYRAQKEGVFEKGKLAVLVDELSASASEVLAGALQDWDRATIIGRRTFGKGLVQEQYELSDGSAMRLTVARYYTPTGRSIQRPYDKGRKVYMEDIHNRYSSGELLTADSIHNGKGQAFKTKGGRTVYGGGGITPDLFVPIDSSLFTQSVTQLYLNGRFNNFVYRYYMDNRAAIDRYRTPEEFARGFTGTSAAWDALVRFAARDSLPLGKVPADDRRQIEERIKAHLARLRWRTQGYYQVNNLYDPMVQKARQAVAG